jgi:hypothetical protein
VELKQLITHFTYRIEPKPGGGFIAHPSDPAVAPLEAATREELQQKIQSTILAGLGAKFPALQSAVEGKAANFAFHIERKPEGGFVLHSADAQAEPIEFGTHNDLESHLAEKLVNFVGKHFAPELAQAMAAQGVSGDLKVVVNPKVRLTVKTASHTWTLGNVPAQDTPMQGAQPSETNTKLGDVAQAVSNKPIAPESSGNWTMFLFLSFLVTVAAIVYFLLHR